MLHVVQLALLIAAAVPPVSHAQNAELCEQTGSMLLVGFAGTRPSSPGVIRLKTQAEAGLIGGVIISSYNIENRQQFCELVASIKRFRAPWPLLIAVTQEGGAVQRLRASNGFSDWPSAQAVAHGSLAEARHTYDGLAGELASCGITFNFGPVLDVDKPQAPVIGALQRAFSADENVIAAYAREFIAAHRAVGIKTAVKHFPGHGSATTDTHREMTDTTTSWKAQELQPYVKLMAAGEVDAVMTSHISNTSLDASGVPATFSRAIVHDLLRDRLGYEGLIISDGLGMGALTQAFALDQIVVGSVAAGHDMLLFSQNAAANGVSAARHAEVPELGLRVRQAICEGLATGALAPDELAATFARIARFKAERP